MNTYRIGELAQQTGCKVETIRFYESVGLLPSPVAVRAGIGSMPMPTGAA